jgi:parallel beta-helix repeat protein
MKTNFRLFFLTVALTALFYGFDSPAFAETYYVSPNGSDSNSGSKSSPWRSLQFSENHMSKGDTLFLRGGKYTDSSVTINVPNVTFRNYPGETPVIDGDFKRPGGPEPSKMIYTGHIRIISNGVTIDGLTVQESTGIGIDIQDTQYSTVKNCTVNYTYGAAIKIGRKGVDGHNTIDNCTATFGNFARDVGIFSSWSNIGQVIQIKGGYNTVKNSTVAYGPCAGIEGYTDTHTIVENNVVYGNGLTQIHFAESNYATIRNNLIYGTERPGVDSSDGYGVGIELMCELWYDGTNWDKGHEAYGNFVANTKIGIRIGWQKGRDESHPNNTTKNFAIYNNTVVEPSSVSTKSRFNHALSVQNDSHLGNGHVIKNNIFWQSSGEIAYGSINSAKVSIGYNLFSKAPSSSFQRSTDPTNDDGYPTLKIADYFHKTSGWNNLNAGSLTIDDFKLRSTAFYAFGMGTSSPVAMPQADFLNTTLGKWDIGAYSDGDVVPLKGDQNTLVPPTLSIVGVN